MVPSARSLHPKHAHFFSGWRGEEAIMRIPNSVMLVGGLLGAAELTGFGRGFIDVALEPLFEFAERYYHSVPPEARGLIPRFLFWLHDYQDAGMGRVTYYFPCITAASRIYFAHRESGRLNTRGGRVHERVNKTLQTEVEEQTGVATSGSFAGEKKSNTWN
jgi:hypothetical protein